MGPVQLVETQTEQELESLLHLDDEDLGFVTKERKSGVSDAQP